MSAPHGSITLTFPQHLADELPTLSAELTDRMHELLERNTDGALDAVQQRELDTLVRMSQFAQILATVPTQLI